MCKDSAATQTRPADQAVLTTERLALRPPRDGDAHALVGLLNDIDNAASHRVLTALGFVDEGETTCATRVLADQPALRRSHTATSWREARARLAGGGRS